MSLNEEGSEDDYFGLMIISSNFSDMPVIQNKGDVIRCVRASYKIVDDEIELRLSHATRSQWQLFSKNPVSADDESDFSFYQHSARPIKEAIDAKKLAQLRNLGNEQFSKCATLSKILPFDQISKFTEKSYIFGKICS